jgi:hypothetical protein
MLRHILLILGILDSACITGHVEDQALRALNSLHLLGCEHGAQRQVIGRFPGRRW